MNHSLSPIHKYRHKRILKKWKSLAEKSSQRLNLIIQFILAEHQYATDLRHCQNTYPQYLKESLNISKKWTKNMTKCWIRFAQLSSITIKKLQFEKNNWNNNTTKVGQLFSHFLAFLKIIYYQYYQNLPIIFEVLKLEIINIQKCLSSYSDIFHDFFAPLNRILQYQDFFCKYFSFLPSYHPDYQQFSKIPSLYSEMLSFIFECKGFRGNIELEEFLKDAIKLSKVEDDICPIYFSFDCLIEEHQCKVFVVKNKVIITKKTKKMYLKVIQVDEFSFVKEYKKTSFYDNLVFFCGHKEGLHIQFFLPSDIVVFSSLIRFIITSCNKKTPHMVINQYKQIKYNLKINFFTQAIQIRHDELQFIILLQLPQYDNLSQVIQVPIQKITQIEHYFSKLYPETNIKWFKEYNSLMSQSHPPKKRENMSFILTEFLNNLFRTEELSCNPSYIMRKLGIYEGIWQLLTKNKNCNCSYCETEFETHEKFLQIRKKNRKNVCSLYMFRVEKLWKKHLEKKKFEANFSNLVQFANFNLFSEYYLAQKLCEVYPCYKVQIKVKERSIKLENITRDMTVKQVIRRLNREQTGFLLAHNDKNTFILNMHEYFLEVALPIQNKYIFCYENVYGMNKTIRDKESQITFSSRIKIPLKTGPSRASLRFEDEDSMSFKIQVVNSKEKFDGDIRIGWEGFRLIWKSYDQIFQYKEANFELFSSILFIFGEKQKFELFSMSSFSLYRILKVYKYINTLFNLRKF